MNHKVTLWAAVAALVAVTVTGCCNCQETSPGTKPSAPPTAEHPKKVTTPEGQVMWVIAEWDACCTPCPGSRNKPCKTAKCWRTKDGKTICVKPLHKCPKNGKGCPAAEHYHSKSQNAVMCPEENPAAMNQDGNCCFAAKAVQNCPANGGKNCPAKEHVNMPEGKKGCSKADCKKTQTQAGIPVELDDSFETDEVFEVTAAN